MILGVSPESSNTLEKWVKRRTPKYPIISSPVAGDAYGIRSYPSYYLVSTSGRVLAGPQNAHFSKAQIDDALASVVAFTPPPESKTFQKLRKAQAKGKVGAIAKELSKLSQDKGLTADEKAVVTKSQAELADITKRMSAEVAGLKKGPDFLAAMERLKEIEKQFKGTPVEAQAKAMQGTFKKDKAIAKELRALRELAAYRKKNDPNKTSGRRRLLKILGAFAKKREGTYAATKAAALEARLQASGRRR